MKKDTTLEDARAFGLPYLSAEEANEKVVAMHQEVGDLTCANKCLMGANEFLKDTIKRLERGKAGLESRNADLEDGIQVISGQCVWRSTKVCDLNCGGRTYCDTTGLSPITL